MRLCAVSILVVPALAGPCQGCNPDPDSEVAVVTFDTGSEDTGSEGWGHVEFTGGCSDEWRLRQIPTAAPIGAWVIVGRVTSPEGWDTGMGEAPTGPGPWVYPAADQADPTLTGWTHIEVTCGPVPDPEGQGWVVDVWWPL